MSKVSLRRAIDAHCRQCGGQEGGERHWRNHVAACPVTTCPLWRVRPLSSRGAPTWLASRDPDDLPDGFLGLPLEKAIALIRGADGLMHPQTADNSLETAAEGSEER